MHIFSFLFFVMVCFSTATAQMVLLMNPETGRVFDVSKYADMNGSPFLLDEWVEGDVQLSDGIYKNLRLKFDVYEQVLYFENEGQAFTFKGSVNAFTLKPDQNDTSSYRRFFHSAAGLEGYIEQVESGRLSFYRSDKKMLSDVNELNRGVIKTFNTTIRYYIKDSKRIQLIKLSEKDILPFMSDRESDIKTFINDFKLNLKREKDVRILIAYYNK